MKKYSSKLKTLISLFLMISFSLFLTGCGSEIPHSNNDMASQTLTQLFGLDLSQILNPGANFNQSNFVIPILFGSFNHVLLSVLLILFAYISIAGTIYTAQDGTFLGKKWSKTWIPLRAIGGAILVFPAKSGFCFAQYIMLSLVYVGIYMGSYVWSSVVSHIDNQQAIPAATSQMQQQVKTALAQLVFNDGMEGIIGSVVNCKDNQSGLPNCTEDSSGVHFTMKSISTVDDAWFKKFRSGIYTAVKAQDGGVSTYCGQDATCASNLNIFLGGVGDSPWPHPYYAYQSNNYQTYTEMLLPPTVKETDHYTVSLNWNLPPNDLATQALNGLLVGDSGIDQVLGCPGSDGGAGGNCAYYYDVNNASQGDGDSLNQALLAELNILTQQLLTPTFVPGLLPTPGKQNPITTSCDETLTVGQGGWWCASNQYLVVDQQLAQNMQAYYQELAAFTQNQVNQTSIQVVGDVKNMQLVVYQGTLLSTGSQSAWINGGGMNSNTVSPALSVEATLSGYTGGGQWATYYNQIVNLPKTTTTPYTADQLQLLHNLIAVLPDPSANDDYSAHLMALFYLRSAANPDPTAAILDLNNPKDLQLINQLYNLLRFIGDTGTWDPNSTGTGSAFSNGGVTGVSFHVLLTDLFQGLLGKTAQGQNIGNIMEQLYNLGTNTDCANAISCHFSMMQNAQVVGVNLIGGVVGSMESIYENFEKSFANVVETAAGNQSDSEGIQIAGALLPFLKGFSDYQNVSNQVAVTVSLAAIAVNLMWLPLVLFVLTGLFVSGITFALIIPLTPYILFWAGKIAWLLLVLEALIAAPLMALGIAYPDGHDIFGIAEPGIKFSFNVVLMPVLLVIGLIVGIVLTYVVIYFSAMGFHIVASNILEMLPPDASTIAPGSSYFPGGSSNPDPMNGNINNLTAMTQASISRGVMSVFLIFIYGTFIGLAFNKCFSTIYVFPEKVLQWLGLQGTKFGEQDLGEIKSSAGQYAKEGFGAGGQSLTQGTQAQQGLAKGQGEGEIQKGFAGAEEYGPLGTTLPAVVGQTLSA
jgi:hypothetical protein